MNDSLDRLQQALYYYKDAEKIHFEDVDWLLCEYYRLKVIEQDIFSRAWFKS